MEWWARRKGIDLLGTGDWFHSLWSRELESELVEVEEGIFQNKVSEKNSKNSEDKSVRFVLAAEISNIFSQGGKVRRVHTVVMAPGFSAVKKINGELRKRGCNLSADGRPIIGLSLKELAGVVLSVDEKCMLIPAHIWTPWFGVLGSNGGFESLTEAFGEFSETGLSSDPRMNWGVEELARRAIVSFGDAHSPAKLGREMTVFKFKKAKSKKQKEKAQSKGQNFSYFDLCEALKERMVGKNEGGLKLGHTVEFYPEEGKYHWDGHRKCGVVQDPRVTLDKGTRCPKCGRELTVGVGYRVLEKTKRGVPKQFGLSHQTRIVRDDERDLESLSRSSCDGVVEKVNEVGVRSYFHPRDKTRPPYVMMVPLLEILAEVTGKGVKTKTVEGEYERLVGELLSEREVLMETPVEKLKSVGGARLAEAVARVRRGEVEVKPGYDGVFGEVRVFSENKEKVTMNRNQKQMGLF